jgi:hypothetical protein
LAENQPFSFADSIREARERLALELRAQTEQIQKVNLELTELRQLHERTEQEADRQWDEMARAAALADAAAAEAQVSPDTALENVLGAVRAMMTCTIPEQVFEILTEEASQWGVRAAIFDVRGKAAWGASACGFGPALSEKAFRSLIVSLKQDNPFRQVCETAGHVDASADTLRKNRNVLDRLKPAPHAPVLLLPIRSAGTVTAIFYADPGEKGPSLPVNALKILAEFAGAQIDRLIALSGGFSDEGVEEKVVEAAEPQAPVEEAPVEVAAEEPAPAEPHAEEPAPVEPPAEETAPAEPHAEEPAPAEPPAEEPAPVEPPVEEPAPAEPHVEEPAPAEPPAEEPAPVEPPVEEPAPAEAPAEEPAPVEPPVEEPAPAEPPVEEPVPVEPHVEEPVPVEPPAEEPAVEESVIEESVVEEGVAEVHAEVKVVEPPVSEPEPPAPPAEVVVEPAEPVAPVVESEPAPPVVEAPAEVVPPPPPPIAPPPPVTVAVSAPPPAPPAPVAPAVFDVSQLSEAAQKVHKDAKRFAKLLVSEIELYNKAKVAEGRKNRDLYKRLKSDIDRSRQTFEKRFGKVLNKQFDYLHEELVKTLAANDATALGPGYPGPTA